MRGVSRKKQVAVAHGFGDETAHRRNALLKNGTFIRPPSVVGREAGIEFPPDPVVRPVFDIFIGCACR